MRINPLSSCKARRGALAVELLFVFPVLLAILLGTVQLSLWLAAQQQVALASREGARVAATGGSSAEVASLVRQVLGEKRFSQAEVQTSLTSLSGQTVAPGDPVAVVVRLPARAVVPDLLAFVGISIRHEVLVSQTVMRKE